MPWFNDPSSIPTLQQFLTLFFFLGKVVLWIVIYNSSTACLHGFSSGYSTSLPQKLTSIMKLFFLEEVIGDWRGSLRLWRWYGFYTCKSNFWEGKGAWASQASPFPLGHLIFCFYVVRLLFFEKNSDNMNSWKNEEVEFCTLKLFFQLFLP